MAIDYWPVDLDSTSHPTMPHYTSPHHTPPHPPHLNSTHSTPTPTVPIPIALPLPGRWILKPRHVDVDARSVDSDSCLVDIESRSVGNSRLIRVIA